MYQLDVLLSLKKLINMEEDFNKPYDNYFLYSNKRWIKENKVPDSLDYYFHWEVIWMKLLKRILW